MDDELKQIIGRYKGKSGVVIHVLQEIQSKYGYISPETVKATADELKISENEIYGVATFYTQFKFHPPGEHKITVCLGTACHVRESDSLLDLVETTLGIGHGETTNDGMFSLERVACLGCCALAPVVTIDRNVHGKMTQPKLATLIKNLRKEGGD